MQYKIVSERGFVEQKVHLMTYIESKGENGMLLIILPLFHINIVHIA